MKKSLKIFSIILMTSLAGCTTNSTSSNSNESSESKISYSSAISSEASIESLSSSEIESNFSSEEESIESIESSSSSEEIININAMNNDAFRLSSISDIANSKGVSTYKMIAPYSDSYSLTCKSARNITLYDANGRKIATNSNNVNAEIKKNDIVYLEIISEPNKSFELECNVINHQVELPYEINSSIDLNSLDPTIKSTKDPLVPAEVKYTKRTDERSLYVNCNNPEAITSNEFNTVLTRQDVTNKDVFFTFEHNNANTLVYYYGYRVTNTSQDDIYVTVKNLGYHASGVGCWLGEDEWIKFYNTKFDASTDSYTASQKNNYQAYVGFSNSYQSENRKPITYRIPSGKYIYVIGGTTADAYNNINVFNSADVGVKGGCANGAVIFSVTGGTAEGAFLVYNDYDASRVNNSEYILKNLESGYVVTRNGKNTGSQYVGYDTCHGVVDADLTWTFNDATKSGYLPVNYDNNYNAIIKNGDPYSPISTLVTNEIRDAQYWVTHINPNTTDNAIGTDMTDYITIDNVTKKPIIIDVKHYDGRGKTANIGNWMVDYIDTFTLINQGSRLRKFTYDLDHNGVILAFVRNEDGAIDYDAYTPKYCPRLGDTTYGDGIDDGFIYEIEILPHSIVRFSVDYNLLANSNGYIKHKAWLD